MTAAVRPLHSSSSSNNSNNSKTANTRKTPTTTQTAAHSPARRRPQSHNNNNNSSSNSSSSSSSSNNNNYRSLLLLAVLMCQLQQFAGGGAGGGFAMAAPVTAPATVTATDTAPASDPANASVSASAPASAAATPGRTRLQKRYVSFTETFSRELNSTVLDWSNGCGGNFTGEVPQLARSHKRCAQHKQLLRTLQKKTGTELRNLKAENKRRHTVTSITAPDISSNQAIDISQRSTWKVQSSQYNFLPRLKANASTLPLRRVHHDLQFYVAAFSYLRHAQLHWDNKNIRRQSVLSAELLRYRESSRQVLCYVEEAINATNQLYAASARPRLQLPRIKTIPRVPMERRLSQFKTPLVELHRQAVLAAHNMPAAEPQGLQMLDALFLKYQYLEYLKEVTQLLARHRKKNCISATHKTAKTSAKPRAKKQRKQRKQRPVPLPVL